MKRKIFLVSGYKGTGKDELFLTVTGKSDKWLGARVDLYGDVFYLDKNNMDFVFPNVCRKVKFTDALQRHMHLITDQRTLDQWYVTISNSPNRYLPLKQMVKDLPLDDETQDSGNIMVTDWRYYHELEFLKRLPDFDVITVRLFRFGVTVPPASAVEEHNLDNFQTDIHISIIC